MPEQSDEIDATALQWKQVGARDVLDEVARRINELGAVREHHALRIIREVRDEYANTRPDTLRSGGQIGTMTDPYGKDFS